MKIKRITLVTLLIGILYLTNSCNNKSKEVDPTGKLYKLTVSIDPKFYDLSIDKLGNPKFVILKEDEDFMFSEPNTILYFDSMYYIMDSWNTSTVLSFKEDGSKGIHFGRIGQGPGEYFRPFNMDVDESGVYIHDGKQKKIIRFDHDGNFIEELKIPFPLDGFKRLSNGDFLLNKYQDGESTEAVWLTDSLFNKKELLIEYPEGFLGGVGTDAVFRSLPNGDISYYKLPLDTLYTLDSSGHIRNKTIVSFGDKELPENAKMNYLEFFENGSKGDYLFFRNHPVKLSDSLWIANLWGSNNIYTVLFDPVRNLSGTIEIFTTEDPKVSIFTPQEILGTGKNGEVISILSDGLLEMTANNDQLPDSVIQTINNGDKVLMIHSLQ